MAEAAERRLARALDDIRPESAFPGRTRAPMPLAARMAECATPAASIAAIDGGELVWAAGFGERTLGSGARADARTLFQAGSVSKVVFALAVMRLVEQGRLDLDADVNGYLASWRVPANDGWQPRITLRQLLSHTAGTTVHGFAGYPPGAALPTLAQILDGVPPANNQPVVVDLLPGAQFRYSGGGTTIAQLVVADVTGEPFPQLARTLIFEPLGMDDSTFVQPLPAALAARAATAHPWSGAHTSGGWRVHPELAAAGLWSTAADLARLGAAALRALAGAPSPLGLERETLAAMLRPQLPDQAPGTEFVGLGWHCAGNDGDFRFGHQGANEGFLAEIKLLPAKCTGAVVMINSIQGWILRNEILQAIGREFGWPALHGLPAAVPPPVLSGYAGLFRSNDGFEVEIAEAMAGLVLRFGAQAPVALFSLSEREFFARSLNFRIRFEDDLGFVALAQGGKTIRLARVEGRR